MMQSFLVWRYLHKINLILMSGLFLLACSNTSSDNKAADKALGNPDDMTHFLGCYTASHDEPAQIKISQSHGDWVMQMKESSGKKNIWDNPEPLQAISVDSAWEYYKINGLGLEKSDIDQVLARPDRILVLAHIKAATKNTNPFLDSEYIAYIFKGANTIYKVECDETPFDFAGGNQASSSGKADNAATLKEKNK